MLLQFRGYSTGYKINRKKFIRFACEHTINNKKLKNKLQDVSHREIARRKSDLKKQSSSEFITCVEKKCGVELISEYTLRLQSHCFSLRYRDCWKLCRKAEHFKAKLFV